MNQPKKKMGKKVYWAILNANNDVVVDFWKVVRVFSLRREGLYYLKQGQKIIPVHITPTQLKRKKNI